MALAMPTGMANTAVTSITSSEPTQAERMPAWPARREGKLVKNSAVSRGKPSMLISTNSATSVRIPTAMAARPTRPKITSQRLCDRMMARSLAVFWAGDKEA
jgi:hypothetical protein